VLRVRDYLYLWHQPQANCLIASGIEFRDVVPELASAGGIVLLRHRSDAPSLGRGSRFACVPADQLEQFATADIYGYGDFCWADFGRESVLADLPGAAVAALTFFANAARPLGGSVLIPGLGNRFLYWGHDDGWYARIFYGDWSALSPLVDRLLRGVLDAARAAEIHGRIRRADAAFWCCAGTAAECEQTEDIDALQQKHLTSRRSGPRRRV
jgi:hypothetical protein